MTDEKELIGTKNEAQALKKMIGGLQEQCHTMATETEVHEKASTSYCVSLHNATELAKDFVVLDSFIKH